MSNLVTMTNVALQQQLKYWKIKHNVYVVCDIDGAQDTKRKNKNYNCILLYLSEFLYIVSVGSLSTNVL